MLCAAECIDTGAAAIVNRRAHLAAHHGRPGSARGGRLGVDSQSHRQAPQLCYVLIGVASCGGDVSDHSIKHVSSRQLGPSACIQLQDSFGGLMVSELSV